LKERTFREQESVISKIKNIFEITNEPEIRKS
jgi:hypothetical protein